MTVSASRGPAAIRYGTGADARGGRDYVYLPLRQAPVTRISIAAYTRGDAVALIEPLRRELARIAPTSAVHWTSTMEEEIGVEYAPTRFYALLVSALSVSALALTSVGLFALLSHAAARRSGEMGIRLALGATPRQVAGLLVRGSLGPLAAGAGVGLLGASWAAATVSSLLYEVGMWDARAFAGAGLALGLVALLAGLLPARRVASVDPLSVLKTP